MDDRLRKLRMRHVQRAEAGVALCAWDGTKWPCDAAYLLDAASEVRNFASPPPGWFTFGTHVDQPDVTLEFWGQDAGGTPIWERPAP